MPLNKIFNYWNATDIYRHIHTNYYRVSGRCESDKNMKYKRLFLKNTMISFFGFQAL